jgi:hypothetical protein
MTFKESIISGLIIMLAAPLIIYLTKGLIGFFRFKRSEVRIDFSNSNPDKRLRFFLRHVRDGKDEIDGRGDIINKDIRLRLKKKFGIAKVTHSKTLGFQYKCYVDIAAVPENEIYEMLGSNGINECSYDESSKKRIWFLLPREPKCITVDGYENNYYHPNRPNT